MTHLQQTCADMLASQEQLQRLYTLDRGMRRQQGADPLREQLRHATAVHTGFIAVCGQALKRHPAANDEATLPGAA